MKLNGLVTLNKLETIKNKTMTKFRNISIFCLTKNKSNGGKWNLFFRLHNFKHLEIIFLFRISKSKSLSSHPNHTNTTSSHFFLSISLSFKNSLSLTTKNREFNFLVEPWCIQKRSTRKWRQQGEKTTCVGTSTCPSRDSDPLFLWRQNCRWVFSGFEVFRRVWYST